MNGGQSKRGNFDSVPADDGFRNYMSRKIELQRKQFGLVLPPPPSSSPPSSPSLEKPNDDLIPKSAVASSTSHLAHAEKKSVRFHDNVEVEGVSQLLNNLKQKYTGKGKTSRLSSVNKRRRLRQVDGQPLDSTTFDFDSHDTSMPPITGYSSVLGVLNNLQRRHGTSSIIRKSFHNGENMPDAQRCGSQGFSILESLEFAESGSSDAAPSTCKIQDDDIIGSADVQPKKRRESPRCNGVSVLELLDPGASQVQESIAEILNNQPYPADRLPELAKGLTAEASALTNFRLSDYSPSSTHSPLHDSPRKAAASSMNSSPEKAGLTSKRSNRADLFFHGIVVLVNGHTSPDATTLMRLLHKHGGDLEKYETQRVTHIIAEQLSAAKAKVYKQQRKPTPIVRPQWIVDSVERGMLLPFGYYLLENVLNDDVVGTKSVKSFFSQNPGRQNAPTDFRNDFTDETMNHRWHDTHPSQASYHLNGQVRTVGNDPNFLESYFRNSRLSYIGSFKQRIKQTKQTCRSRAKEGSRMFVLLVDMDYFFAAVALRKFPQYRDNPVAIGHSHVNRSESNMSKTTNSSSELSTCNYIARNYGIRKGMFLGDAIKLCPELIVLPYDFEGYEEVSGIVASLLDGFAEQYNGCTEQVSCDEIYVEINLDQDEFDGNDICELMHDLAEHLREEIFKKTECTASIGIGPNKVCQILPLLCVFMILSHFNIVTLVSPSLEDAGEACRGTD